MKRSLQPVPLFFIALLLLTIPSNAQNLTNADRSAIVLTTAKAAFNDQNYPVAAERFREFLRLGNGSRLDNVAARFGLGVCLLESPEPDPKSAIELLASPASLTNFSNRPQATYYLGVAYKLQAQSLAPTTRPAEPATTRRPGDTQYTQAASQFATAADLFQQQAPADFSPDKPLPEEWEWVAKSRCEQADSLLRAANFKSAALASATLLDNPKFTKSRYRDQAAYYNGYANFALADYPAAVRSLSSLAPFEQPEIGPHARYLLARTHHLANERPEAVIHYQSLIAAYDRDHKALQAQAIDPATPQPQRDSLLQKLKNPPPQYIAKSHFYLGIIQSEFGQPDEAASHFESCAALAPDSPLAAEARLHAGITAVQSRKFPQALASLTPILTHPQYADQALRWFAKAQYGVGTTPVPKGTGVAAIMNAVPDPAALAASIKQSITTYQKADEVLKPATDAPAKERRAQILLELGDMQQLDRQYPQAAASYAAAITSAPTSESAQLAAAHQVVALQLAGQYDDSDKAAATFNQSYPKSPSRPDVMVRYAENALLASAADPQKHPYDTAVSRFNKVIEKFPDTPQSNQARMGLGTIQYLQSQFAQAAATLSKIPEPDRTDDLIGVSFLLADCNLRTLPDSADDAITSARVAQQLEQITTQLEAYAATKPNAPETAQAHLRIGYASQKLAALLADPAEKRRTLAKARRAYTTLITQFPDHPAFAVATLENAKILNAFGNAAPAVMELSKFQAEPLSTTPIAPLALIHLAESMRQRNKPADAVALLTQLREKYEPQLAKDPIRKPWLAVLQFSQALALKESAQYQAARDQFARVIADSPKSPDAIEALWRIAQCQLDPALIETENTRRALVVATNPATQQELIETLSRAVKALRAAADAMSKSAADLATKESESDVPIKMNQDAAYAYKTIGEVEIDLARRSLQADFIHKSAEKFAQENPNQKPDPIKPPEIPLAAIPLQPGEKSARDKFKAVIDTGGDSPLVDEARIELADLYTSRNENDAAIALYKDAIAKDPPPDQTDRLKLRMGSLLLAKNDPAAAYQTATEIIAANHQTYTPYARALAIEARYQLKDLPAVIELAAPLLEVGKKENRLGVSDHALLRLAHAQFQLKQVKEAKATLEAWFPRFPSSPLLHQALHTYGEICENLGDADSAITAYTQVAAKSATELAAQSNYRIGVLRLAQNRPADALTPLLTTAYAYDTPDLNAAALLQAAQALTQLQKPTEAKRLLQRLLKDFPKSQAATPAQKKLEAMK